MKTLRRRAASTIIFLSFLGLTGCGISTENTGKNNASEVGSAPTIKQSEPARPLQEDPGSQGKLQRCHSKGLKLEVVQPEGGAAAGSQYYQVKLTNVSKKECNLYGFAGISFTDANGQQIGQPTRREGDAKQILTLPTGGATASNLRISRAENFAGCAPKKSATVKVYPPEEREALTANFVAKICSSEIVNSSIGPVSKTQ